jgi:hypothetical protein
MAHIFVSYSHKDTDYAHGLAENLQSMGFEVWIDARLDYGSQWPHEIQKQLDACDAFILIMSPRSFASEWVQSELQRAKRKLKPIFPLLLEGDEPWLSIESTQYFDVRGGRFPDDKFYSALMRVGVIRQNLQTSQSLKKPVKPEVVATPVAPKKMTGTIVAITVAVMAVFVVCGVVFTVLFKSALFPASPISSPFPTTAIFTLPASPAEQPVFLPSATQQPTFLPSDTQPDTQQPTVLPPTLVSPVIPSATLTSVPTVTNVPTITPKLITSQYMEAEAGELGDASYLMSDNTADAASNKTYVNMGNLSTIKFTFYDLAAGQYEFVIRYAKYVNNTPAYSEPDYQNLYVNSNPNPFSVLYVKTFGDEDNGFVKWLDSSAIILNLERGTNILLLKNNVPGYPGAVGVDRIFIRLIN